MNERLKLILNEVSNQFKSQRAFYQTIDITQRTWEKYKNGETNFDRIKFSTYEVIVNTLFTRYEIMLVSEAVDAVIAKEYDDIIEAFYQLKRIHANAMLENGASMELETESNKKDKSKRKACNEVQVVHELDLNNTNTIIFRINTTKIPSGKQNRLKWYHKYIDKVVVK